MVKMKNMSYFDFKAQGLFLANPLTGDSVPLYGSLGLTLAPYWITVSVCSLQIKFNQHNEEA